MKKLLKENLRLWCLANISLLDLENAFRFCKELIENIEAIEPDEIDETNKLIIQTDKKIIKDYMNDIDGFITYLKNILEN